MYRMFFKRFFDIVLATGGIIFLAVPMCIIAVAIKLDSNGPVFFKQKRVGQNKEYFEILKFRTMKTETPKDVPTHKLSDPQKWITRVGKILRKTSLDELPQIFNILKGEMSVIGPRPALWNQYDLIEERDKYEANSVRPGLTGLAQINGRDELEIPVKAKFDGEYVEKMSLFFDCKCFLKTIRSVFKSDGFVEGSADELKEKRESVNKSQ